MATIQPIAGELEPHPDVALVERVRGGDVSAYDTLVRKYERQVFRIAQHITQNREDAEDVMQDAFLKAYEKLDQFQGNSKFYTWLVRIAVNESLMRLRKRRTGKMVSIDEDVETEEGSVPRDLADWAPDPEQNYTQAELARKFCAKPSRGCLRDFDRLCPARCGRSFHRGNGRDAGPERSRRQVAAVARPAATARAAEPLLPQQKGIRRSKEKRS
jgi:RNA polymerase sigma factor (sigma-70 family)